MGRVINILSLHDDVIKWKTFSALLAFCAGISPVTNEFVEPDVFAPNVKLSMKFDPLAPRRSDHMARMTD